MIAPSEVSDDRGTIEIDDRFVLIVEDDVTFAKTVLEVARERGFKGIVALRGDVGLALAHEYKPDAIVLDMQLPVMDGWAVLDHLKRHPDTRHIPVHVVTGAENGKHSALRAGAVAFLEKPVEKSRLDEAFQHISSFLERGVRNLLVVDDDETQRTVDRRAARRRRGRAGRRPSVPARRLSPSSSGALRLHRPRPQAAEHAGVPAARDGEDRRALRDAAGDHLHGQGADAQGGDELRRYAETIIVKDVRSPERLLDETSLFLHRVESTPAGGEAAAARSSCTARMRSSRGKQVLVVDDDVRNVFALTSVLEAHGMDVRYAENGVDAIKILEDEPDVDIVLMDIMMPELDGYETIRHIRSMPQFESLPIISLTAKAMKGDREKSHRGRGSDYITKPVDTDKLVSLLRVWLYDSSAVTA